MPYDFDALIETTTKDKPKEPEVWQNRYRAIGGMRIKDFEGAVLFIVPPNGEWLSPTEYPSASDAVDGARRFDAVAKAIPGEGNPAMHGRSYLYLGPEKQP